VDIERTLETQRLRLLRIVAGLVLIVGILAVGPVSRRFSDWTLGFVGSVLSRAEAAMRYLVITQACLMIDRSGLGLERRQIPVSLFSPQAVVDTDVSLMECRRRLKLLRAMLMDLPRYALRLLRRIAKRDRRGRGGDQVPPRAGQMRSAFLSRWQLAANRIERPPDNAAPASPVVLLPSEIRAGAAGG